MIGSAFCKKAGLGCGGHSAIGDRPVIRPLGVVLKTGNQNWLPRHRPARRSIYNLVCGMAVFNGRLFIWGTLRKWKCGWFGGWVGGWLGGWGRPLNPNHDALGIARGETADGEKPYCL